MGVMLSSFSSWLVVDFLAPFCLSMYLTQVWKDFEMQA